MGNVTRKDEYSVSVATESANAFFQEVTVNQSVWAIRDEAGFPTATSSNGKKAMPFWSTCERAKAVVSNVRAYNDFEPHELTLNNFRDLWLSGLQRDGLHVGLNWSGGRALGYDYSPSEVLARIRDEIAEHDTNA